MSLRFTKFEAIGNTFVLIDSLDRPELDWPRLARRMCANHFGVGADGLLAVLPSKRADFRMLMFNSDGSEDVCGNGLRCVAAYVCREGYAGSRKLVIEQRGHLHEVELISCDQIRAEMGSPSLRAEDLPANLGVPEIIDYPLEAGGGVYRITCVQTGSPHAVIFAPLSDFWEVPPAVSAAIEVHPAFPERVSVTWCCAVSRDALKIHTWERAVGPTLGCGTGACAALVAANILGLSERAASVTSPGGTLQIEWVENLCMTGPARAVFEGVWLHDELL
ncbi:MAG: diaminopimelate epimerase [Armatimonadota bacterium]